MDGFEFPVSLLDSVVLIHKGERTHAPLEYTPIVTDWYPRDKTLPPCLSALVFTEGVVLTTEPMPPKTHSFVLTCSRGVKQYAVALVAYEALDPMQLIALGLDRQRLWSPFALVLLSHWNFLRELDDLVSMLYRISLSQSPLPRRVLSKLCLILSSRENSHQSVV